MCMGMHTVRFHGLHSPYDRGSLLIILLTVDAAWLSTYGRTTTPSRLQVQPVVVDMDIPWKHAAFMQSEWLGGIRSHVGLNRYV